jgi:hypothetical protein
MTQVQNPQGQDIYTQLAQVEIYDRLPGTSMP